jgi:hypothetical protein
MRQALLLAFAVAVAGNKCFLFILSSRRSASAFPQLLTIILICELDEISGKPTALFSNAHNDRDFHEDVAQAVDDPHDEIISQSFESCDQRSRRFCFVA